jgi:hypothetical protein
MPSTLASHQERVAQEVVELVQRDALLTPSNGPFLLCALVCLALFPAADLRAQALTEAREFARKQATAVSLPDDASIEVDGRLDDEAWQRAPAVTDFVQKEPVEGAPATERMEVRFVYSDSALYVGARMFSSDPSAIQAPLSRRDNTDTPAENFLVSLDTFLDRRTAFTFGVTASGVRIDRFYPSDDEGSADDSFDPVWLARTMIDDSGWTAELWIPFSQLRFNEQPEQVWGLNLQRFIPTLNEQDFWSPVPLTEQVWASRFGDLRGIAGIRPTRRLELMPFVVASSAVNGNVDVRNPLVSRFNPGGNVGLDVKMGLGPGLTLQGTVNPDFGQVEADPAEVNLTAIPTLFPEKRPFFTEDSQFLRGGNLFTSRRIGDRPQTVERDIPVSGDYVDYPSTNTILGAVKITGRVRPRTSIGILAAVTGNEYARSASRSEPGIEDVLVAPPALSSVARVTQEFGNLGSTASVFAVGIHRAMDEDAPITNFLSRNYLGFGAETLLRLKGGEYEVSTMLNVTFTEGEPQAIERIQRSSVNYAQRPDRTYARLDPTRTTVSGYTLRPRIERIRGTHWLFGAGMNFDSPRFYPNELGRIGSSDSVEMPSNFLTYRETRPGRIFRNYTLTYRHWLEWNYALDPLILSHRPRVAATWRNFWTSSLEVWRNHRTPNTSLTRGGPMMETPAGWIVTVNTANSSSSRTRWSVQTRIAGDEDGGFTREVNGTFSFTPSPRWQLSLTPSYEHLLYTQQYVTTLSGGRPETFSNRYIFAAIERSTLSTQLRAGFTLKPDVNIDVYAEPFAASGHYSDHGELLAPRTRERLTYGTSGTTIERQADGRLLVTGAGAPLTLGNNDFLIRSFRSTIVLRWEWRPGSTLYVVGQQAQEDRFSTGTAGGVDLLHSFTDPGQSLFMVKMSYWLPVN